MTDLCSWKGGRIECKLPITEHTSKVRVKRNGVKPVATRREVLTNEDYIEWQISYIESNELIEFGKILSLALNKGLVTKSDIDSLVEQFKDVKTFEDSYDIYHSDTGEKFKDFKLIYEKTPILRYECKDGCYIDIAFRHKQKAVGYQAIVNIYIPLKNVRSSPIGRTALPKEVVTWSPDREHILGLLKAFLIASRRHREDVICKVIPKALSQPEIDDC